MNFKPPKNLIQNQNNNMFISNFSLLKVKDNKRRMSFSILNKKRSITTKKKSPSIPNETPITPLYNNIMPYNNLSCKNNRYSFNKSILSNNDSMNSKQKTCISQPKKIVENYDLENHSNIIDSNHSFLEIENNLIKEINKMKNKINQKQKNNKKVRNSCLNLCAIDIKDTKKINGNLTLYPAFPKGEPIKKNKSFDFTDNSLRNLRKRIKNKIKSESRYLTMKKYNILESSDSDDNEKITKYISFSPNSTFLFIFDALLIISNLYSFIFIPLSIAKNENIFEKESIFKGIIKYINDFIYMLDFLISLVRGYYNYEMKIIRDNKRILIHYLKQDFLNDLIEGIPIYVLIRIFNNNIKNIKSYVFDYKMFFIKLLLFIKSFKIFKIIRAKKNRALEDFYRNLSIYYYLEKTVFFIITFIIFLLFIHLFICLHIFFALQSYPNWISYSNVANEAFIKKYITSFYFLITTMTTVGYGDIVCISTYERIFHIILLGIGTILYSFIVSKIGNYLREQSYEEMKLNKDLAILESIRLTYPSMPFNLL